MITLYGIKNCDTVKKARRWLEANGCEHQFHDFRVDGLSAETVDSWLKKSDWNTVLNRRSTTWKQLDDDQRDGVDETNVRDLLVANPTLVKRPVTVNNGSILIGFKEEIFADAFL
ncbi:MAG: ArsC family reductase [Pseudomonadales bacterium]